jgi:hypothetical protein
MSRRLAFCENKSRARLPHKALGQFLMLGVLILPIQIEAPDRLRSAFFVQPPQPEVQTTTNSPWGDAERGRWLADFEQLIDEMSAHYANLEWAVDERHMDLAALRSDTETKIRSARSEDEERKVLSKFLDAFGDGHLEVRWPKPPPVNAPPSPADGAPSGLCSRLGYVRRGKGGIDFSLLAGYQQINDADSPDFPGGILKLETGVSFGIIRIAILSEHDFPDACAEAITHLRLADSEPCDDACDNKVEIETGNILLVRLQRRAEVLRRAGANQLLVDITRNGGGSDWVGPVARTLSPVPLQDSRMLFMRHPHWTHQIQEGLDDIGADLRNGKSQKELLELSEKVMQKALLESKQPCDRSALWTNSKPPCSLMVPGLRFSAQVLPYAKPGSFPELKSRTTLFHALSYSYEESKNNLPLVLLVDKDTWSAAEYLPALLQDNKAARVIGELTGGAGCGYTDGGIPTVLKNSGGTVKMPDCIRLRADGSDEVDGITPDVLIPWASRDTPFQRARKLEKVLKGIGPSQVAK